MNPLIGGLGRLLRAPAMSVLIGEAPEMSVLIGEAPEMSPLIGEALEMIVLIGEASEMSPLIEEAPEMVLLVKLLIWRVSSCSFSVVDAQPCDYDRQHR
jgi:hypothetical protein